MSTDFNCVGIRRCCFLGQKVVGNKGLANVGDVPGVVFGVRCLLIFHRGTSPDSLMHSLSKRAYHHMPTSSHNRPASNRHRHGFPYHLGR